MTRVLAVDDEPAIRRLLRAILERAGYEAVVSADSRQALEEIARGDLAAVVLDLGLPDRDGLEVIGAIRAVSDVPVLVVTARTEVSEKIAALDLGADDYVTKPFDGDELLARLRSSLRRASGLKAADILDHGPISMDLARHTVMVDGRNAALTRREFAVLQALVEAGGRILTHTALLERVWGKAHRHDIEYLRVVIRALRLKIEEDPSTPQLIRNEPGIGYRLSD